MRFIKKKQQPQSLIEAKKTVPLPKYGELDTQVKDDIRTHLLEEQGFICCYCMQRIEANKMKIEHYKAQNEDKYPELQLEFGNMLAACKGEIENDPRNILHCDSAKGKEDLVLINPHDASKKYIFEQLKYTASGEIKSDNEDVQKELEKILNLNQEQLKNLRKSIIDGIVEMISRGFKKEPVKKSFLENQIEKANTRKKAKLSPFCQVKIYYLEKKLRQMPK